MILQKPRIPIRTALLYALFAALWILFSDRILLLFVDDLSQHSTLQTLKGWFFVIVSACLLYVLLRRELDAQQAAGRTLLSNERQLHLIYETISDIAFLISVEPDGRYRFVSVNSAFLRATGLRSDQVIERYAEEVVSSEMQELVFGNYKRAMQERIPVSWEEEAAYPAGTKAARVTVNAIYDDAGVCTHLVGVVHDLTEIKKMLSSKRLRLGQGLEDAHRMARRQIMEQLKGTGKEAALNKPVSDLQLSVRARKALQLLNIQTLGDLASHTEAELMGVKNFGATSLTEVKERLTEYGLALRKIES